MENTLSLYVESLHEHWDMPDTLALKWNQYEADHQIDKTDKLSSAYEAWMATLNPDEKNQITRRKAEE